MLLASLHHAVLHCLNRARSFSSCWSFNHQRADALSRQSPIGEEGTTIEDAAAVMLDVSSLEKDRKVCTKTTKFIENYDDDELNSLVLGLPMVCSLLVSRTEMNVAAHSLANLFAELAREAYCPEVAATVWLTCSYYSYDRHGILVPTSPFYGAVQTMVPNSLRSRLYYSYHNLKLTGHPASVANTTPWEANSTGCTGSSMSIGQSATTQTAPETVLAGSENAS